MFDLWVGKIPWRKERQPPLVLLPEKSHEQRSLVGYSPWGRKESDPAKHMVHTHSSILAWRIPWIEGPGGP